MLSEVTQNACPIGIKSYSARSAVATLRDGFDRRTSGEVMFKTSDFAR